MNYIAPRSMRQLGVIVNDANKERGFVFIADEANEEYFAHTSGFERRQDFEDVTVGDAVSFKVSETPKGKRAFDIRYATVVEKVEVAEWEESRGNR